jgi:hypothetical protein
MRPFWRLPVKSLDLTRILARERRESGATVFSVTELANPTGTPRRSLWVQLSRLTERGLIVRLAHGLYGTEETTPEVLLQRLDPGAYEIDWRRREAPCIPSVK